MDFTRTRVQKNELVEVQWDPTIASDPGVASEMKEKTRRPPTKKERKRKSKKRYRPEDTFSMPDSHHEPQYDFSEEKRPTKRKQRRSLKRFSVFTSINLV